MTSRLLTATTVLALLLVACGNDEPAAEPPDGDEEIVEEPATEPTDEPTDEPADEPTDEPADEPTADPGAADGDAVTVDTAMLDVGEALVDADGHTLYLFDRDEGGESACYDDCAATWPPLLADGEPATAGSADAALVGTVERTDGTTQVTYGGHPLYYFAGDAAPGEVNGQGVGDVWWAVDSAGEAVHGGEEETRPGAYDY